MSRKLVVLVGAVLAGVVISVPSLTSSSPEPPRASPLAAVSRPLDAPGAPPRDGRGPSGDVGSGVTVFDDLVPAVAKLDPELLDALQEASRDAGVTFYVNSGWRSPEYQERLLREAVSEYGSEAEAARWVATPATSPHVSGDAVDLGRADAVAWLSEHGAGYGLCQIYDNEPWHYELRPDAVENGCPPLYADPTHDPRMQ